MYFAFADDLIQFALMCTIEISMHFAILCKNIFIYFPLELLFFNKVIFTTVDFTLPWSTSCVADA